MKSTWLAVSPLLLLPPQSKAKTWLPLRKEGGCITVPTIFQAQILCRNKWAAFSHKVLCAVVVPFLNKGQDFLFPKTHISSFTSWDLEASSVLLGFILRKLIITAMHPEEDSRGVQETSVGPSEHWVGHACLMEPWLKDCNVVTITRPVTLMLTFSVSFIPSQSPHQRQRGQTSYSWHPLLLSCLLPPFMPKSSNCSCFPSLKRAPPAPAAVCHAPGWY